jgi:hypothetical protein
MAALRDVAGAHLADLPDAKLHFFETCHFALEENLNEIAV